MLSTGFSITRLVVVAALMFVSFGVVNAYTLVLRSGRRLEVPHNFIVSGRTLTYEVSAGIQVTVQLATIDISSTEQANDEMPGSFLKRDGSNESAELANFGQSRSVGTPRSITNADLETYRRVRVESERAYEQRRIDSGLPSREELQRKAAADTEQTRNQWLKERSREQVEENYWRSRAARLRNEIVRTDAQIAFLETRLTENPGINSLGTFATVLPLPSIVRSRVSPALDSTFVPGPHIVPQILSVTSPQFSGRAGFGTSQIGGGVAVNSSSFRGARGGRFWSGVPFVAAPFASSAYGFERSTLLGQLDQLRLQRAKLQALWRDLEDEARRASAYPGWLRP
jgi:hypothetical protein